MLAAFPLLVLPVALYNLLMLTIAGGFTGAGAGLRLSTPLVSLRMASRAAWPIGLGDMLLAGSLLILFTELLKSAASRRIAILNHSLSAGLFVLCLIEFLVFPAFATSTFFLIGLMVLLDVAAGFIVTLTGRGRDLGYPGD